MNSEADCDVCRRLLEAASVAITGQLRAIARLDKARMRQETDLIPAMEAVVRDARQSREEAVAAYQRHRRKHETSHVQNA